MKEKIIHKQDVFFNENVCDIREYKENERFSRILEKLKKYDIIKSYKEFADNINETSVGLNDIKKGRKKLSVNHVKNINIKYPFINTDFILFEEGLPFLDDYLIKCRVEGEEFSSLYEFDLDAIMNCESNLKNLHVIDERIKKQEESSLIKELLSTKNELLVAKDKIMILQSEVYELRLKLLK